MRKFTLPFYRQLGNCDLHLVLQKDNVDLIGDYTAYAGSFSEQTINHNSNEEFYFDNKAMKLNIDRVIHHPRNNARMVEGTLSCLVFKATDPAASIPTVGNFRMYIN